MTPRERAERFYLTHSQAVRVADLQALKTEHGRDHRVILWQGSLEDLAREFEAAAKEGK